MKNKILLLLTISFTSVTMWAWGPKGHDVVAEIASRHISKKTAAKIDKILDGKTMVYYSSWMDGIKGLPAYKHTYSWHFLNVDPGLTYETAPLDSRGDVYSKTVAIIDTLKAGGLSHEKEKDLLRFLIHMVGDIHCPMHVGYARDLGGNRVQVMWFDTPTNLHSVWDSKLIESVHNWSYGEWADNIDINDKEKISSITAGDVAMWRDDVLSRVGRCYDAVPQDGRMGYPYINAFTEDVEYMLLVAGLRLSKILDDIYK